MDARPLYDFLSFVFIISLISLAFAFQELMYFVAGYAVIYTILVLILGFRKSEKTSYKIAMLIGSIILVGIMPFIYYITYLRKVLAKEKQASDIKKQVLSEIQYSDKPPQNPQNT